MNPWGSAWGGVRPIQEITWAALMTAVGAFDGDRRRLPSLDGLGDWVQVIWNATTGKWGPDGVQTLASYDLVTGNSATTSTLTIPTTSFTGGPVWAKTKLEILQKLSGTVNGCSAAPVNMNLVGTVGGTMALIGDTTATIRRKSFKRVVDITAAAVQFCHAKLDNAYTDQSSDNSAPLSGTVNTGSNFTLTSDVSTGWVNGSAHVLSMPEFSILWRR